LGVIAYMLLTGAPPFNADSSDKIHSLILTKEPDFTAKMFPRVVAGTVEFVRLLLTKDPNNRITMDQAFRHPFIQQAMVVGMGGPPSTLTPRTDRTDRSEPNLDVVVGVGRFMRMSRSRRLMLEAVAFALTPAQVSSGVYEGWGYGGWGVWLWVWLCV
jgi:serine/threonine protein kinase